MMMTMPPRYYIMGAMVLTWIPFMLTNQANLAPQLANEERPEACTDFVCTAQRAAINGTVILMTVNHGYTDFALNWLAVSARPLNLSNLVIVALDRRAFAALSPHARVVLNDSAAANAASYGTREFGKVVTSRPDFVLELLRAWLTVLYVDVDALLLRAPWPHFAEGVDMCLSVDGYRQRLDITNSNYCSGFFLVRPTPASFATMIDWKQRLQRKPQSTNQDSFNAAIKACRPKTQALPLHLFRPGWHLPASTAVGDAVMLHNNFIIGHDKKRARFIKHRLWACTAPECGALAAR